MSNSMPALQFEEMPDVESEDPVSKPNSVSNCIKKVVPARPVPEIIR
jgi:hypothetical protein